MPSSVADVFGAAGLAPSGVVRWGQVVPSGRPGVYAVTLVEDPNATGPGILLCPIRMEAVEELLAVRPELRLNADRPTAQDLADRVESFWIPDEVIVYLGLAGTALTGRLNQYYGTPLGARSPHAGGWFLKLLTNLNDLYVHWSECEDPAEAEDRMMGAFCENVSKRSATSLRDPQNPLPFANLRWPRGGRKSHGITGATAAHTPSPARASSTEAASLPRGSLSSRRRRADVEAIGRFLQDELRKRGMDEVAAVEAARWLEKAGILKNSQDRPGLPLRNLLRKGLVPGQRQETNNRWFINRIEPD